MSTANSHAGQGTFACAECATPIAFDAAICSFCGYPYALVQGPRSDPEPTETVLWEGRASFRAAIPALFRFVFSAGLVVLLFEFAIRRLPGWICDQSAEVCREIQATDMESVFEFVRWAEMGIVALLALRALWMVIEAKRLHVKVTNERLVRRWGLIARHTDEIDMRLVVDVTSRQSVLERMFGVGHLIVHTNDPYYARVDLRGLPAPEKLRETIRGAL